MPVLRCRPWQIQIRANMGVKGRMNAKVKAVARQAIRAAKAKTRAKARAAAQQIRVPNPGVSL
jgi:hypothetical protein